MIRTSHFARLVALFAVGLIGLSASRVAAQTYTNVTGNWTNAALWVGGVAPVPGTTTSLTFGTQANPFDNLGYTATNDNTTVPFVLNSITLTSTAAATNVLNGNALQFAGSAAINQNGYGPFTIANNINVATNTSLAATGIGWVELSGSLSGASSLTRSTGSGATYILSGSNSGYSGTTVLSAGILRVTSANGLGTGSVSIGGATLEVRANNIVSGPVAYGNNITVNGSTGANLTLANNGGTFTTFNFGSLTFVGTGTLNANFTPNSQGNSVSSIGFANAFSSAVFAGPVSLITNVSNGFAVNGNAQTLGGAVSQSFVRLDGAISQTGTSAQITKTGGGTLIITTVGNTYSGITNVNAGTLRVQPATSTAPYASSLGTNAAISQNGGTLDLRLNGAGSNGVIAFTNGTAAYNITHAGAANTQALFVGNNGTGTGNVVQLGSLTISNSGSTYQVNNNNGYGVAFTGAVNFPAAAASVAIAPTGNFYYPAFSAPVDASFVPGVSIQTLATGVAGTNFIKSSQGTLLFAGASNSFAGTFTARNGTTLLGADITATGNSVIGVGASVLVTDTSVATDNITALLTVGSGRVIARPITVQNFSSGAVYLGASDVATSSFTGAVTLNRAANLTAPAGATVTFGGAIGGTGTLYKTEAGTAVLTAANNFTGATGVYGGTLRVGGAAGSLTATPSITVSSGGTLVADNSTSVLGVRLGGGNAALTLGGLPAAAAVPYSIFNSGGTLQVDSTGNGGSGSYSEQFNGILTLGTGASRILANSGSVQSQIVFGTASSGIRRAVGASGTLDISNNGGQVSFINLPLVNGLIGGYATVNGGASWATTTGSAVVPYASFVNSFTLPTDNVDLNGGAFLTGANTVHTIRDNTGFQTVDLNGGSLRITGGILVTANAIGDSAITNGTVYAVATQQGSDLIVHQYNPTSSFSLPNIGFTIQPQPRTGTLNATTTVTFTGSTSDLFIGQGVTGTNIPANTTIAAISGSTVTLSAAASGSGASTLTFASTASGLTKTGPGILDLTGVNVYAGPTTISAGTVRFQPGSASAPASAVSIAGGATLDLNDTTQFVGSLNGSGVTSIGAGTLYLGSDGTSTTYAGQITTGAAGRFVKVGGGTQVLTNIATGTAANNLGSELVIAQGLLEGRTYLSGSNPFGSGAVNVVVAGGTAVLRTDGNNTGAAELVTTFNNLSFATGGVDASGIPYSTNGTIDINRNLTTNIGFNISANKTVQIAGLTIGRGVMTLSTSSNLNGVVVTGTTTLTDGGSNFTFNLNSALNLGVIADSVTGIGNTLNLRVGGSAGGSLFINAPSTAVGGAYLLSGTTNFGSVVLGAQLNSTTANLGTGLVTVAPGAGIRLNGAGNIGSRLDAISNLFTLPNINLATNISPAALNVRSISYDAAPGFVNFSTAIGRTTYTTTGGGTGLINLATMGYTGISDLRLIGGGNWSVGGLSGVDGELGNSNAQGLIPGAGNVYRLAGNGGGLQVDYDILHDMPNGVSTLLVGGPILSGTASLPTSSNTRFLTGQSFTGPTQVGRGSQVEFREPVASSSFELFGTLSLTGNAALTTAQAANVVIRPGGILVADNNINQTQVIDRIPDATNFALNSGGLQYRGANGTTETVANVSFDGGSSLSVNHVTSNATLALGNLTRTNFGTLGIGASGAALGLAAAGDRVTATNAAEFQLGGTQTTTVGTTYIVRPYIVDTQNNSHVTYGGTAVGFTDAAYVALASGQTGGTTIAQTAVAVPLAAPTDILALRITGAVAVSGSGANTLTIRSGGVIATASGASITAPTLYGATGTSEADIYVATSGNFFDFGTLQSVASTVATRSVDGQITAVNLVKFGPGGLRINGPQPTLSGSVIVNQGILELRYTPPDAITGTNAATLNAGVPIVFNGPGTQFNIRTNIANYVFDQPISIGAGVPTVTFDANSAGGTYGTAIFRSLTFGGAGGTTGSLADQQGQIVNQTQNNTIRFNGGTATSGNILNLASGLNVLQAAGTFEFVGPAVGPSDAVLVKNGAGAVTLIASATGSPFNAASSFSAALVNNGTLELRSNATTDLNIGTIGGGASAASPSTLVLNGGTLNLRYTASNPGYNLFSNIVVSANATASLSTSSGNTATPITVTGGLTIGNQTFFINGGNGVNWQFTGATTLTGNAVLVPYGNNFSGNGVTTLNGAVTDGGRDVFLTKNGSTNLRLTAAGSYTGGTIVNNGTLDLAIPTAAGSGNITLNPSGGVFFSNTGAIGIALGNFATTGGQRVIINSSPVSPVFIAIGGNFNPNINGTNGLNVSDNTPTLGNVLAISGTNSQALNLATLGNGRWALGLTPFATNATYSATTLGVGSDGIYRLGAGAVPDNNGTLAAGTLTISAANVLVDPVGGGTSRLQIGLPGYIANGFGIVTLNNAQSLTGGVVVNRGSILNLNDTVAAGNGSLQSQTIDIFGTLTLRNTQGRLAGGSTINVYSGGAGTNAAGRLDVDNNQTGGNRIDRLAGNNVNLYGGQIRLTSASNIVSSETIGTLKFRGGSSFALSRTGTGNASIVVGAGSFGSRTYGSTLTVSSVAGATFGSDGTTNLERLQETGLSNTFNSAGVTATSGMAPAWIVNSTDNSYVAYNGGTNSANTAGFASLVTTAPTTYQNTYSNVVTSQAFPTGLNTGAETVNYNNGTTVGFLQDNPDIYALRVSTPLTPNPLSPTTANSIRIRSGGLLFATSVTTFSANLNFADSFDTPVEGLIYVANGATVVLQSELRAQGITKFGTGNLQLYRDINYNQGWNVNQGTLQVRSLGALGTADASNTVTLNGNATIIFGAGTPATNNAFFANQTGSLATTPLNATYTSGVITSVDYNTIQTDFGNQSDRTQTISAITLDSWSRIENGTANSGGGSELRFVLQNARNTLRTGVITASDNAVLLVTDQTNQGALQQNPTSNSSSTTPTPSTGTTLVVAGIANAFVPGDVTFTNRTSLTKIGNLLLVINGDNSTTFTGGAINISQGGVQVANQGSLGSATTAVNVARNAALDIAVANYAPANAALFSFAAGSAERWSVPQARPNGYAFPAGVTWQLNSDVNPATAYGVTLRGGSIEGYLASGLNVQAVNRTISANVTVTLAADSFVGQNWTQGSNGVDNGVTPNVFNPNSNAPRGASLFVNGPITGAFSLTKTGYDTVTLAGANSYGNTLVDNGVLRIGAANSLPAAGTLIPRYSGIFDLNGFNQTARGVGPTAALTGTSLGFSGNIQNSATQVNTLTVAPTATHTYAGTITGGVSLAVASGATGIQNLSAANSYLGGTLVNGGTLRANNTTGSATGVGPVTVNSGGTLGGAGFIVPDTYPASDNRVTFTAGSTLSPGNSIGTLTIGATGKPAAVSLTSAAYTWEVPNTAAGIGTPNVAINSGGSTNVVPQHDLLAITGSLNLMSPTINVVGVGAGGFDNTATYSWVLATFTPASASSLTGTPLFSASNFATDAGMGFTLSLDSAGGRVYLNYAPVPEPACVLALTAGAAGLAGLVRRRLRKNV